MRSFLAPILCCWFAGFAVYGKEMRNTAFINPRVSNNDLIITFDDFVEQKLAVYKIALPYDVDSIYHEEEQTPQWMHLSEGAPSAMISAQTGMNLQVTISPDLGFKQYKPSTLELTVEGEVPLQYQDETDMILIFSDPRSEQYISSVTRFDNGDRWEYPQCGQALASGDVLQMADGSDFRLWKVSCPADAEGALQCEPKDIASNDFPVSLSVTNDPREQQVAYRYTSNHATSDSEPCVFTNSNFTADGTLNFFISADGAGDDEGLRISNISVTQIYCDDDPEWISNYNSNGAFHLQLTDSCDETSKIQFVFQTITRYTVGGDGNGVVSHVQNGASDWQGEQRVTAYGEAPVNARENTFEAVTDSHRLGVEMLIFDEETAIDEHELSVGDLKFSIVLESADASTMLAFEYTTKVCLMIQVLPQSDEILQESEWQDAPSFVLGRVLRLQNEKTAQCEGIDGAISEIAVITTRRGYEVCYAFGACRGRILYDPYIFYEEDDGAYRPNFVFWLSASVISCVLFVL